MSGEQPPADHVPDESLWGDRPAPPDTEAQPVMAELVEPAGDAADTAPRPAWTALVVCVGTIIAATMIAGVVLALAAYQDEGLEVLQNSDRLQPWIRAYGRTLDGLLVLLLPGQLVFLTVAVAAALFSPRPLVQRLGLTPGTLPVWTWLAFALATPVVGLASSLVLSLFVEELSENLKTMEAVLRWHADSNLPALILFVAVLPGVVEELMFRGYLQTRLVERWSPGAAIGVSAVVFAAAHLDVVHGIGVLPLGIWLGAIAWRTGSVWPAMLCHTANNAVAVIGLKFQPEEVVGVEWDATTAIALIVALPAFLISLYILRSR